VTKKDFEALAAALKQQKPSDNRAYVTWRNCVIAIMDVCSRGNPEFSQGKFISACGVPNILQK
jgi:hypothetical protein